MEVEPLNRQFYFFVLDEGKGEWSLCAFNIGPFPVEIIFFSLQSTNEKINHCVIPPQFPPTQHNHTACHKNSNPDIFLPLFMSEHVRTHVPRGTKLL